MNRIALLENETDRIKKRATLTKQKASEIFYNKAVNEDKIMMQMKMDMEQAQILEELRLRNMQLKAIQRNDFVKKLNKMKDELRTNAEQRKSEKLDNDARRR